jgi:hypothetical protein
MRVLLAGLLAYAGLIAAAIFLSSTGLFSGNVPSWAYKLAVVIVTVAVLFGAYALFNKRDYLMSKFRSAEEHIRWLESHGLLVDTTFKARRAFGVKEADDEGPHYFIELDDGRILYLNGQYLYDYEQTTDDPELNQPRRFPCTEFTTRRHKKDGYVVEIKCAGAVLEPELIASRFTNKDRKAGFVPEDGDVISDVSYEAAKMRKARKPRASAAA